MIPDLWESFFLRIPDLKLLLYSWLFQEEQKKKKKEENEDKGAKFVGRVKGMWMFFNSLMGDAPLGTTGGFGNTLFFPFF